MTKNISLIALILFILTIQAIGQLHVLKLKINNQTSNTVLLGTIQGDQFAITDTLEENNNFLFKIPHDYKRGNYRLILGQTSIAEVLNEPPQKLDFIYNDENIEIQTDFNMPMDSADVIISKENQIWFDFIKKEKRYQNQIQELVIQINHFQHHADDAYYTANKRSEIISKFNSIQHDRSQLIAFYQKKYPNLYVTKLIQTQQEPFQDSNWSELSRKKYLKNHYFDQINFSEESLINSSAYTDKVFKYFMLYAQKELSKEEQEKEFKTAIDVILNKTSANPNVSVFIVDYLLRGFEKLGLDNLQVYVSDNYMVPHGCTDDNNTLKRRLAFQQMNNTDSVPDFILTDLDGGSSALYNVKCDYKLVLFWETSCPMCKEILSQLKSWYYGKDVDLEIFAVSIDEDKVVWEELVSNHDYPWINLNEPHNWDGKVATAYNLYAIPTMFLLDGENRILAKPIDFGEFLLALTELQPNIN